MIRKYLYGGPGYFLGGVTAKDLDEGTKKVAKGFNWLMGKVGDAFNTVVTAGASSDFGQTSPFALMDRKAVAKGREQFRQKAKKTVEENAVYVSPSSHIAAWTQGSWDPKVGALFLASDPRLLSLGIIGDMTAFKYVPKTVVKGVKTATKAVKGKKASNETAYSKEVKSPFYKYNENGEPVAFDAENVYSQIKAGKQDFINETLSPEYAEAVIRNMEEALAMGLSYTPVFEKPGFQSLVLNGITPKFVLDPKGGWHASTSFFGGTPGRPSEVTYNVSKPSNIRTATAHESGHISRWGMGESPAEHQYMKHKASLIFKDEGDVGVYEFGSQTGEGATNMRDLGKDIGVTLRTPYPGYEEALKKLKEAETTSTKGGIVKALRLDKEHMPYIWRALQGLHYGIAPTLIGGYSLYNLLNSGTPQVDYQKFGGIMKAANARKWKHKEGGKIDFLSLGGGFSNILKNVGSWALDNKSLINGVGGALVSGIGLFKNSSASADFRDSDNKRIQEGYNAIVNDLGDGIDEEVNSLIAQMKEQNPDLNFGEIDYLMLRLKVEQLRRLKNMLKADMYKLYELEKQGKVLSSMEESNTSLLGGLLSKLGGIGTDVLNSKSASATKGTATGSTVGTTGTTTYVGTNGSLRLNNMLA